MRGSLTRATTGDDGDSPTSWWPALIIKRAAAVGGGVNFKGCQANLFAAAMGVVDDRPLSSRDNAMGLNRRDFLFGVTAVAGVAGIRTLASAAQPPARNVEAVRPPSAYPIPGGGVRVSNGAELRAALASPGGKVLILAKGTYDNPSCFKNHFGHQIVSETLGGAIITAGIQIGSNRSGVPGAIVQGATFDISDHKKLAQGSPLCVTGQATNVQLLDLVLKGNGVGNNGVVLRQPIGAVMKRIIVRDFQSNGLRIDKNDKRVTLDNPVICEDIDVAGISRPVARSAAGAAEAGIWVGEKTTVRRVKIRKCAWMGIWTGSACNGSQLSELDVDVIGNPAEEQNASAETGVAVYCERFTQNTIFERYYLGPGAKNGFMNEGMKNNKRNKLPAASTNVIFQDGVIHTGWFGVVIEPGNKKVTVRRTKFIGQRKCVINDHGNDGDGNLWDTSGNDYSMVEPSVPRIFRGFRKNL